MKNSEPVRLRLASLLSLVILGVLFLIPTACDIPVPATTSQEPAGEPTGAISAGDVLFRDDFQDGDSEGWQIDGAWAVRQDGDIYTFDATGRGHADVPAGMAWDGDYAFRAWFQLNAGVLTFTFDATTGGRYCASVNQDVVSLVKQDAAGNEAVLAQAYTPGPGGRHYIVIAKQRGTIQVFMDRDLWLLCHDDTPLTAGTIVVASTEGTTAWVDNVLVSKITTTLPQGGPIPGTLDPRQFVAAPEDDVSLAELPASDQIVPAVPDDNRPTKITPPIVTFTGRENLPDNQRDASDRVAIEGGGILLLEWQVENACAQFLNRQPVEATGWQTFKVLSSEYYSLEVIGWDGLRYTHYVHVKGPAGP